MQIILKKILVFLVVNFVCGAAFAQISNGYNNINSAEIKQPGIINQAQVDALTVVGKNQNVAYFDGLGRPLQQVAVGASGSGHDLIVPTEFDNYGRQVKQFLPYTDQQQNGSFRTDGYAAQRSFYNTTNAPTFGIVPDAFPFVQTFREFSPIGTSIDNGSPGNTWQPGSGHSIQVINSFNKAADKVRKWTVLDVAGNFGSYSSTSEYLEGDLYKTISNDEHGKQVIVFKDREGKVLLKKVQLTALNDNGTGIDHSGWLCTYYIYDDFGLLRAVIQPNAIKDMVTSSSWSLGTTPLAEYCFRYEYDQRGRIVMKQVPGVTPVYMVYDMRDRLVLTQDGNMRTGQNVKWMYILYDDQNRPQATGLWTNSFSLATQQNNANNSINYPNLSGQNFEELTRTFYDNYDWLAASGNPFLATRSTLDDAGFVGGSLSYPYAQSLSDKLTTTGLPTGGEVKVLGTNTYLFTINYYDNNGRIEQTQSQNITGGKDVTTIQYNFAGQPLESIQRHNNNSNPQTHIISSRVTYDYHGRMIKTEKKINSTIGSASILKDWTVVETQDYDELGRVKAKHLGNKPGASAGTPLANLNYEYNIRNWLLSINKDYVNGGTNNDNYFSMSLGYDQAAASTTLVTPEFNGNINATAWRTSGDGVNRQYAFGYDAASRLLKADYTQTSSATSDLATVVDFSMHVGNGIDPNTAYDANGNILKLFQKGLRLNSTATIDDLTYSYFPGTNRLQQITDASNDNTSVLGDFKYDPLTKATTDYTYDVNGNIISDNNRKISGIGYNYLNLPLDVQITDKGSIVYSYDASGKKLSKTTVDHSVSGKTITTVTKYINGFVYESKSTYPADANNPDYADVLQLIPHEEGRIRFKPAVGTAAPDFAFDYFVKDHLGNIRMVLTDEQHIDAYPAATLETANLATEQQYYNIPADAATRVNKSTVASYPTDNTTSPNDFIHKLSGNGTKIGSSIVLKVMSGDKFNFQVSSWYKTNGIVQGYPINLLPDLLTALIGGVSGASAAAHGTVTPTQLQTSGALTPGATNFLNNRPYNSSSVKAYVNWILFDEQFNVVSSNTGAEQVPVETAYGGSGPKGGFAHVYTHTRTNMPIDKNGYLFIYVSNETPNIPVYFDNLQVTHTRGAILEETHYYPFGLTMAGISSKAAGGVQNKYKFGGKEINNSEFADGSGFESYDFGARHFDPQIGRWFTADPLADKNRRWSPYNYAYNNPLRFIDPDGMDGDDFENLFDGTLGGLALEAQNWGNPPPGGWVEVERKDGSLHIQWEQSVHNKRTAGEFAKTNGYKSGRYLGIDLYTDAYNENDLESGLHKVHFKSDATAVIVGDVDDSSKPTTTKSGSGNTEPDGNEGKKGDGEGSGLEKTQKVTEIVKLSAETAMEGTIGAQKLANSVGNTTNEIVKLSELNVVKGVTVEVAMRGVAIVSAIYTTARFLEHPSWGRGIEALFGWASAVPGIGWASGLIYFVADMIVESVTGKSLQKNIDGEK